MDTTLPTGRSGRLAALGITLIALLIFWLDLLGPLVGLYQDREENTRHQAEVAAHMSALAAELPRLREQAAASAGNQPAQATIEGSSDAVAAAALQSAVQEMATTVGANLASIENVPAETAGSYRRIGLKLSLDASWTVLINLLAAIDRATPPMLVDNVEIHASPVRAPDQPIMLDIGLTVYALRVAAPEGAPS